MNRAAGLLRNATSGELSRMLRNAEASNDEARISMIKAEMQRRENERDALAESKQAQMENIRVWLRRSTR